MLDIPSKPFNILEKLVLPGLTSQLRSRDLVQRLNKVLRPHVCSREVPLRNHSKKQIGEIAEMYNYHSVRFSCLLHSRQDQL